MELLVENSTVGTIATNGLYTAPQILPQQANVTVQAISQADGTTSGSAFALTIIGGATVTVMIAPLSASIVLGATQQFSAIVSNAANQSVTWNVNGIAGGNALVGTISATGLFTAPQILPQPASATVQAISQADAAASASVQVTITSDVTVSVTPPSASVELGAVQIFTPHISSAGNPNVAVTWSVAGPDCANASCGTIDANGNYVAPGILPTPATVTVTARSVADATKFATVPVTITSRFTLGVTGPSSVNTGTSGTYVATLTPIANSNPNPGISWSVSGAGCTTAACGTISPSGTTAIYQAPISAPTPPTISITATPTADPTKAFSLTISIVAPVTVVVTPGNASVPLSGTQTFSVQVTGNANTNVTWDVNGVVGGNATVGTVTNIPGSTTTYTAPAASPSPPSVIVHAVSVANPTAAGQAGITFTTPGALVLTPTSATSAVGHRQPFNVTIFGSSNTNVIWQVNGIAGGNTTVGQICVVASNPCQAVSIAPAGNVEYLAPASIPSPNPVTLSVSSQAFPAQVQSAQITELLPHIVVTVSPSSANVAPAPHNSSQQIFSAPPIKLSRGTRQAQHAAAPVRHADSSTRTGSTPRQLHTLAKLNQHRRHQLEDSSRTGNASVTITNAITIVSLLPASATAGA